MKALLLAAAVGLGGLAAQAAPVALNDSVAVADGYIRLGDLFRNAGDKAEQVIAQAPAPGQQVALDARWLYRVAQAYGLAWQPYTLQDRAVVRRESQVIGRDEIEARILEALRAQGPVGELKVALTNPGLRLHVALDRPPTVMVEDVVYDPRSRRFVATIAAPAGDPAAARLRVSGRAVEMTEVPVLKSRVLAEAVIRADDIGWMSMRADQLPRDIVSDAKDLIGMSPRRTLRPGAPVRASEVRRPILVPKGSPVTMLLRTPNMTLTAKGRALDEGGEGDVIRVANAQSNLTVDAVVVAPNTVAVRPDGRPLRN